MPFPETLRTKVLLWCDRHCCLCKKACGPYITVHHIEQEADGGGNDLDNALPVCFDCHGVVGSYNDDHPIGTKLKPAELKKRREQIYEEFTRHLVPPVEVQISQQLPNNQNLVLPQVGICLTHRGSSLPVRVRVKLESRVGAAFVAKVGELYDGSRPWNLNPQVSISTQFTLEPYITPPQGNPIELRITLTVIDAFEREHELLPATYVKEVANAFWWLSP